MEYEEIIDGIAKDHGLDVFANPFFVRSVALDLNKGGIRGKTYVEILFRIEKDLHVLDLLKTKGLAATKNSIMAYYEGATGLGSKPDVIAALSPLMALVCPKEYAQSERARKRVAAKPKPAPESQPGAQPATKQPKQARKQPGKQPKKQPPKKPKMPRTPRKSNAMPGRYEIMDHFTFPKLRVMERLDAIGCGFQAAEEVLIQAKCKNLFIGYTDDDVPAVFDEAGSISLDSGPHAYIHFFSHQNAFFLEFSGRDKEFYVLLPRKRRKYLELTAKNTAVYVYLWGQTLFDSASLTLKGGFAKVALASDRLNLKARGAELNLHAYFSDANLDIANSCESDIDLILSGQRRRSFFFGKFSEAFAAITLRGKDMPDMPDVLPLFRKTWGRYDELDYGTPSAMIDVRHRNFGIDSFAMQRL